MSSSVFIESSSATQCTTGLELDNPNNSDLVVVYGKNGISFDQKGLEKLIEEKSISSISVIRLSSPTPSMDNNELDPEKLDDLGSSGNSETCSEKDIPSDVDAQERVYDTESTAVEDLKSSDNDGMPHNEKPRGRRNTRKKLKSIKSRDTKLKTKRKRDRPDIVGLNVEEFYSGLAATDLLKSALKLAGVPMVKKTAEHEFMLYVIQNDHNYTPFTSPEQMKQKLAADKSETERATVQQRKAALQTSANKHLIVRKKQERLSKKIVIKHNEDINSSEDELDEGDAELSGFSGFDESATSDNDRDSDLDYKLTNRRKQKGKMFRKLNRNPLISKIISNKRGPQNASPEESVEKPSSSFVTNRLPQIKTVQNTAISNNSIVGAPTRYTLTKKTTNEIKPLPARTHVNAPVKSPTLSGFISNPSLVSSASLESPQTVKEIVINKVIPSPKGVFTNISALLSDCKPMEHIIHIPTIPKTSTIQQKTIPVQTTPSKGFTPLGLEAAEKNQLPAQISVQTHQSSSEIAAENDKQLDLIDSIVQDEMQKTNISVKDNSICGQNIPELVKMLESTETTLEPTNKTNENSSKIHGSVKTSVDEQRSSTLDSTNDVLPEDLLQHVVDLIEEDRTLKEAVEKQVFGNDALIESIGNRPPINETAGPLKPVYNQELQPVTTNELNVSEPSKSIIQMSISNLDSKIRTSPIPPITPKAIMTPIKGITGKMSPSSNTSSKQTPQICGPVTKIIHSSRTEPIKIIRGNGRIITLPPIEAPTTRAKRRAQVHPTQQHNSLNTSLTETSLDSSIASNTSFTINDTSLSLSSDRTSIEKQSLDSANKIRSLKDVASEMKNRKKGSATRKTRKHQSYKSRNENEASESQDDDDDPNKLWCICRQPHNNRFMICCDSCEDWFHGTCVNITKAMGIEMEQKGIDWTCPKCVKIHEEKKQPKITDMLVGKKSTNHPEGVIEKIEVKQDRVPEAAKEIDDTILKHQTDMKNILSGQFITLQDLSQSKKSQVDQKKIIVHNLTVSNESPVNNPSTPIKTSQTLDLKPAAISASKHTAGKLSHHGQYIKVQKAVPMSSILTSSGEASENCIVCKKIGRSNSIYCSDECINKYVRNVLQTMHTSMKLPEPGNCPLTAAEEKKRKVKSLFEDLLSMADRKPKMERLSVFERKSGRTITGINAPTASNLKKWLQDNPTFEVVSSGCPEPTESENKIKQKHQQSNASLSNKDTKTLLITAAAGNSTKKDASSTATSFVKSEHTDGMQKHMKQQTLVLSQPSTPKQLQKYPQHVAIKADKQQKGDTKGKEESSNNKDKSVKRQNSDGNANKKLNETGTEHEPIRLTVRRTLKEQLLLRIKEYKNEINSEAATASTQKHNANNLENDRIYDLNRMDSFTTEVENFAHQTEIEMYKIFNHDTGAKYRAKYRSLMFNIKDRKNRTLFSKICSKQISSEQLVRMSPEELASQELAQWRENETKHQLEMIKKSELDLLACTKNYVLKTHKGEELIEETTAEGVNVDFKIPEEDVFSMLNSAGVTENSHDSLYAGRKDFPLLPDHDISTSSVVGSPTTTVKDDEVKLKNRNKDRERHFEHANQREPTNLQYYDKKYRNKSHHKNKTRSYKRSRSRSRSRSQSREKRYKSSSQKEYRDGHADKDKTKDESERKDKKSIQRSISHSTNTKDIMSIASIKDKQNSVKKSNKQKSLEAFNLVDQILESTKTVEEAANLVAEKNNDIFKSITNSIQLSATTDNDQEPTSTVSISTPPQDPYLRYYSTNSPLLSIEASYNWSGIIHMIDVTTFQTTLQSFPSHAVDLALYLPKSLEVVGRISPETVWDYVSKIKKSPNKEIILNRLLPCNESETSAYIELYEYLHTRKRLGVIKTASTHIRDFYIYPLGASKKMPPVFQITDVEEEFFNDPFRPDMLIGIIIKVLGKRVAPSTVSFPTTKYSRITTASDSPKRKKHVHSSFTKDTDIDIDAIIKAPIIAKTHKANPSTPPTIGFDADEPYSPGGSSDSDIQITDVRTSAQDGAKIDDELKRKMEELNRQIAVQEMEIAGLLNVDHTLPLPSTSTSKVLANISIPPDLSQILASIRTNPNSDMLQGCKASNSSSNVTTTTADDEYDPEEAYTPNLPVFHKPSSTSRLAQLSEAELLRMVPDDMVLEKGPPKINEISDEPPPPGVG